MENNKLFRTPEKLRNKKSISAVKDVKRVAIVGIGSHSGASFVTGLLAAVFSCHSFSEEEVSIIELGSPYFFEAYGIEKRFIQREFLNFYDILYQKGRIKGLKNIEDHINWVLRCPLKQLSEDSQIADTFRLIHNVAGTLLLFDCSAVCESLLWDILPEMDTIIAVIDPLPSKLIPQGPFIQRLRLTLPQTVFVVNKMNKGVHKGELRRFLQGVDFYPLPLVTASGLYKAEYNCVLPYAIPEIRSEIEVPLRALLETILRLAKT